MSDSNNSPSAPEIRARYQDARLLVVDDKEANLQLMERLLATAGYYHITTLQDARQLLPQLPVLQPDLILLDVSMPPLNGIDLLQRLPRTQDGHLPVIILTAHGDSVTKQRALRAGADDFLTWPVERLELLLRVEHLVHVRRLRQTLQTQNQQLEKRVQEQTQALTAALRLVTQSREEALSMIGLTLEYRDYETKGHTERTTRLAVALGRRLGLGYPQLTALKWGAYLHDIGKLAISDNILLKPQRLSPAEFEHVKDHVVIGEEMLSQVHFLPAAVLKIVRHHHERWDGGGYPDGLRGSDIPYLARIFSVVDVYDALISKRPYKPAWTREDAVRELLAQRGQQFDAQIVEAFLTLDLKQTFDPVMQTIMTTSALSH